MQIRRIIIFLVFTINILSMTQFGKAFGDKKDNFFIKFKNIITVNNSLTIISYKNNNPKILRIYLI